MTTPVPGIAPTPGLTPPLPSSSTATPSTGLDKDAFLKLLVAQLKYQDPDKPMDSSAYMSQMAQFTQVEKLGNIETAQTQLSSWQRALTGESMIGKTITARGTDGQAVSGTVSGISLGTAGTQLLLAGGGQVSVDNVQTVLDPAAAKPAPIPPAATTTTA